MTSGSRGGPAPARASRPGARDGTRIGRQADRGGRSERERGSSARESRGRDPEPGGRGRRSRGRFIAALAVSVAILLVSAVGAIWIKLNGNISTFDANGESKNRPPASLAGENVLLLGSDSRSGSNRDFAGGTGDVGRSDTAILLHVFADHRHALGVSIPRDSLVTIPPCLLPDGTWSPTQYDVPFNAAFSMGETVKGNPACTQNTVEALTGLRVDHTVVVDFAGFAAMTDAVHGVQVCVPQDVYQGDVNPNLGRRGTLVFAKGLQTVSGTKALDYVRLRHGIGDGSDIGRTQRQQAFIAAMIKKVQGQGFNVTTLLPLADAATKSLTVDPGLDSAAKLMSFAMSIKGIDLKNIQFITAPWRYAGEKIALVHPDVDNLWAALKADRTLSGANAGGHATASATPTASPTAVDGSGAAVSVYNGTSVPGLAARAAGTLRGDDFAVIRTATAASQTYTTTLVQYGPGQSAAATALARLFPGARLSAAGAPGLLVVLGSDYAAAPPPATSTATALPSSATANARTAAEDPCQNLTYGSGG